MSYFAYESLFLKKSRGLLVLLLNSPRKNPQTNTQEKFVKLFVLFTSLVIFRFFMLFRILSSL